MKHGFTDVLTPDQRVRFEANLARLDKALVPRIQDIRDSQKLTAEDFAIRINATVANSIEPSGNK